MTILPAVDVAAARANVSIYAAHVKLTRSGNWLVGNCPLHEDRNPSFAIKGRRWYCFAGCGGGDTIEFLKLLKGLDFVSAVRELCNCSSQFPASIESRIPWEDERRSGTRRDGGERPATQYIASLWRDADHPELAELYLASRGINLRPKPLPWPLRGHHRVYCTETKRFRPALLAAVSDASGGIVALQRIWCERTLVSDNGLSPEKGTRAADLSAPKKVIGPMGAGAVRLAEPANLLGLAEGVETALSAAQLYRLPVWATLGAQRLGSIELPEIVKTVVIFGDSGAAGEKAAAAAVSAYRRRGYQCEVVFPERGVDFNEQLMRR